VASHFANGGMVNAPIGQAVPAILHGGEEVISYSSRKKGWGSGTNISININGGNFANEYQAREISSQMVEDLRTHFRF